MLLLRKVRRYKRCLLCVMRYIGTENLWKWKVFGLYNTVCSYFATMILLISWWTFVLAWFFSRCFSIFYFFVCLFFQLLYWCSSWLSKRRPALIHSPLYTVSQKRKTPNPWKLRKIWTDFQNSFTVRLTVNQRSHHSLNALMHYLVKYIYVQ